VTDDRERLLHISEAIESIGKYRIESSSSSKEKELTFVWLLHHLQIIGEAAARISKPFQELHPYIPWQQMIAMRNILVHQYFEIDENEIKNTIERDIPLLKQAVVRALGKAS